MATFYLDYEGGNDANDGTTFANRWKTITSGATAARIAPGDTIRVMASPDPTSLGQAATWTNLSKTVALTTAVTANIDDGEAAWTASSNVTSTADTTQFKENIKSAKHAIAAGFVTGLASYKSFASTDFSGYKQISFWIRTTVAIPASALSIKLCSDAVGVTAVDTFVVPAIPSTSRWVPITVDKGSALGSAIQSVALYVDSDFGAVDIFLDNIIACKDSASADSLTLTSLIGKNTAGETWHGIQSINGTTVLLDNGPATLASAGRGYSGTTESVTTYKRETIKVAMNSTLQTFADNGSASGGYISFEGGWDRTDMSAQSGVTWWDGQSGAVNGLVISGGSFISINKFGLVRFSVGVSAGGTLYGMLKLPLIYISNNSAAGISLGTFGAGVQITDIYACNNTGLGLNVTNRTIVTNAVSNSNTSHGIGASQHGALVKNATVKNNGGFGVQAGNSVAVGNNFFRNLVTANNALGGVQTGFGVTSLYNALIGESTEFEFTGINFGNGRIISIKHDQTADNHLIVTDGGTIVSEFSVVHS